LAILLEETLQKVLTVKPQLVGRLHQGTELVSVDINPNKVVVVLPAGAGKRGEIQLMTTPIYLENISEDSTLFCKIIAPSDIQPRNGRWPDVQVQIKVRAKSEKNQ
jgi:YbbR domain-containing protein